MSGQEVAGQIVGQCLEATCPGTHAPARPRSPSRATGRRRCRPRAGCWWRPRCGRSTGRGTSRRCSSPMRRSTSRPRKVARTSASDSASVSHTPRCCWSSTASSSPYSKGVRGLVQQHGKAGRRFQGELGGDDAALGTSRDRRGAALSLGHSSGNCQRLRGSSCSRFTGEYGSRLGWCPSSRGLGCLWMSHHDSTADRPRRARASGTITYSTAVSYLIKLAVRPWSGASTRPGPPTSEAGLARSPSQFSGC